ncbi:MAG: M14 family zinc carboxypeptidase [Gammaproteobacteria bacterium]
MKRWSIALTLLTLATTHGAQAVCEFDASGTITNPDDPSCRDARFVIVESGSATNEIALGYAPPIPVDSMVAVDGFRLYDALHAQHQALFLGSDNVDGSIVGQTLSGRDIWAYKIGDLDSVTPAGRPEPAVMINGGIHAREWQSPEVVTELFETLVEMADDDGLGKYLSDHLNVVIVPVMNIDGFIQTQQFPVDVSATRLQPRDGRLRRKNLRRPDGGALVDDSLNTGDDQFDGVDLNRNMRHGFGQNGGSSAEPISQVYRGTGIASEPESRALINAATLAPASQLRFYVDAHSFSRQFFIPNTTNARRNEITRQLAERIRLVTGLSYANNTTTAGTEIGLTSDFFAVEYDIPSWTLEIEPRNGGQDYGGTGASHSGFILPDAEVARVRDENTQMLLLGYYRMTGPPAVKAVQITRRSDDALMYRADWQDTGSASSRTLNVTADEPLTAGTGYRLWVAFDKPMRTSTDGTNAAQYPGQNPPPLGSVSLDAGPAASDFDVPITGDLTSWLGVPGGAPNGYDTYQFDAFGTDFDMPASTASVTLSLSLDVQGMSGQKLDANPASAVGWEAGAWTGYDDEFGDIGDDGGADCQLTVRAMPDGGTAPAAGTSVACKASFVDTAAPPPTPPLVTPQSSGGGGAVAPLALIALLLRRRLQQRKS